VSETALRFEDVSLAFEGEVALDHVSFQLPKGQSRIVLGAAGSGKTVLLKVAIGLVKPDSGHVYLFDQEISGLLEADLYELRSKVGVLFQEGGLFDSLSIEENVGYPLVNQKARTSKQEEVRSRVEEALRVVELDHTLEKYPSELSGGMRRRVGIARANVTEPPLVLYDSPTAGLDPITANNIMSLIIKERDLKNTTTVMATHRYQDGELLANYRFDARQGRLIEANQNGDRTELGTTFMVLRQGRIVFEGTQPELEASPDSYVSKFVMRH
jgi:phospholipid/cholesterol/gamma-HCH transport system ATP-binding protein